MNTILIYEMVKNLTMFLVSKYVMSAYDDEEEEEE